MRPRGDACRRHSRTTKHAPPAHLPPSPAPPTPPPPTWNLSSYSKRWCRTPPPPSAAASGRRSRARNRDGHATHATRPLGPARAAAAAATVSAVASVYQNWKDGDGDGDGDGVWVAVQVGCQDGSGQRRGHPPAAKRRVRPHLRPRIPALGPIPLFSTPRPTSILPGTGPSRGRARRPRRRRPRRPPPVVPSKTLAGRPGWLPLGGGCRHRRRPAAAASTRARRRRLAGPSWSQAPPA